MKTFTDNTGRTWTLVIHVDALRRVRALVGVNLMEAIEGKLIERLVADPVLLCDVIYALAKPEADAQQISDEAFGRAMAGDAIEHATTSLLEELISFFPTDRRRLLSKAMAKLQTLNQMAVRAAEQRLDSGAMEQQLQQAMASLSPKLPTRPTDLPSNVLPPTDSPPPQPGDCSGNLPESSAWTPQI